MVNITRALHGLSLKHEAKYPEPLPSALQPFYCYPLDCGHSILVLPAAFRNKRPVEDYLVPAPVRTVLQRGWKIIAGVPVVEIEYSSELGLIAPPEDEEW